MSTITPCPIYEMSLSLRMTLQAHTLSNSGSGSNRLFPRQQLLADGTETDALSGNITKHYHAALLAERLEASKLPLCPACVRRDGRRAAALVGIPGYSSLSLEKILKGCSVCDAHGFLITAKNESDETGGGARQRLSKSSLLEFSFALAHPNLNTQTEQLFTRTGDGKDGGQMLLKRSSRSGVYALCIRYKSVGIGVNTDGDWEVFLDVTERTQRHQAILSALCDQMLSPMGALTSTMLPHLTRLSGAFVLRTAVGRAFMYSGLEDDFIQRLAAMADQTTEIRVFQSVDEFKYIMDDLIANSFPCAPAPRQAVNEFFKPAAVKAMPRKSVSKPAATKKKAR